MNILTELGYALMCQVKEKEKNVVLKMLLYKRVKAQQEIKMAQLKDCNYFQFKCSLSRICLVALSGTLNPNFLVHEYGANENIFLLLYLPKKHYPFLKK